MNVDNQCIRCKLCNQNNTGNLFVLQDTSFLVCDLLTDWLRISMNLEVCAKTTHSSARGLDFSKIKVRTLRNAVSEMQLKKPETS